jgi:H+/Cl- antiporter ClcA
MKLNKLIVSPLTLLIIVVCAPVCLAIAYLFFNFLRESFEYPTDYPLSYGWNTGGIALYVSLLLLGIAYSVIHWLRRNKVDHHGDSEVDEACERDDE